MFKDIKKRDNKRRILKHILRILVLSICFNLGIHTVSAAPIKILNNSNHAYSTIVNTINQLLGRSYTADEFTIHYTAVAGSNCVNPSTFTPLTLAIATSSSYEYCDSATNAVTPPIPYHLYTDSFSGYPGDSVSTYNTYAAYDLADNYAFISYSSLSIKQPPVFRIAPGWLSGASALGVEWRISPTTFCSSNLSCITAANAGILGWLRLNHPTWNWLDTKAALRQTAANWATGYSASNYGFGLIDENAANALTDVGILLQPPAVATSTTGVYSQINFTVFPFKQTRRVKEVLFQFPSNPGFQANELTLAQIQALGGTKITEYTGTTATTTTPIFTAVSNAYFVWFTADNATDGSASFSRIDTYNVLGPLSQNEILFDAAFDISSPVDDAISSTTAPTLAWNGASSYLGISKYQLFIDGVLDKDNISGTSTTPTASLSEGTHTWYVKAFNGGGTATTSVSTYTINVISGYASGHTFYVDNVLGDDDNPGTEALPWATLTKAGNTAQAGDTVVIIKNVNQPYRDTFSSTAANAIFRGVDKDNKPEIWGSDDVSSGWSSYGGGNPNTYQKSLSTQAQVVAAGPSIGNLTKKTEGASATTLNPGEWKWSSNVLYYRLDSGENISTLHIEAGQRGSSSIASVSSGTLRDVVIRYSNGYGASIRVSGIGERIEIYDSANGVQLSDAGPTLRYSIVAGSNSNGIHLSIPQHARIYNNVAYGNDTGLYVQLWAHHSIVRNNIFSGNSSRDVYFNTFGVSTTNFSASHNNWSGTVDSDWTSTYQGSSNQAEVAPLLTDAVNRNFRLQSTSPNIDTGTSISGLTTDILGNPIYGTPDIGPYEYQPPYTISTDKIPLTGTMRLYKDGKYRMTSATSSAATANMTITPEGGFPSGDYGEFLNVTISSWNTSGDYSKLWTESSSSAGATTHTVGDLAPNAFYAVSVDGTRHAQFRTDASGQGTFTYSGGYSTHTFSIAPDLSVGGGPIVGSSFGLITDSVSSTPTLTATTTQATSTQSVTTTTTATQTTPTTTIQEQIVELQTKLVSLLKELVALLTEQLQNITKTI